MNNKFDELTKSMAQSVTRRAALKKFGVGLAGMALACFGLANKAGRPRTTGSTVQPSAAAACEQWRCYSWLLTWIINGCVLVLCARARLPVHARTTVGRASDRKT